MSNSVKNANEWISWIEAAIAKEYVKYYEYKHFSNIQEIGSGRFGKVSLTSCKDLKQCLMLKSFFNLNNVITKEIIREVISKNPKLPGIIPTYSEKCSPSYRIRRKVSG